MVDAQLAGRLVQEQFPEVPIRSIEPLAQGWDNTVWLVNGDSVFRFPRRAIAIPGVEREIAVLPELAPHLPLTIPVPVFVGHATDAYPWPFFGSRLVPGRELADADLTDAARASLAASLARFLRALHAPALLDVFGASLPVDPNHRADMAFRVPMTRKRLAELRSSGLSPVPAHLPWLDEAESLPPSEPTATATCTSVTCWSTSEAV